MGNIPEIVHPVGLESAEEFFRRFAWLFEGHVKTKFGALYLDQIDEPGPEHDWLMDGWLSTGDRSIVAGQSRSGKSFFAIHVSMCIAFGMDVFGFKTKPGGVVYQAGEGARGVKKRLRAWRAHHGVVFDRQRPFVLLSKAIDLYRSKEGIFELIDEINAHAKTFDVPLRLVVIDTLAAATVGADEISGKDMGIVLENVATIQEKTNAHVMLVHHMNASGQKVRGHTSIYANLDQVLLVSRDEATKIRTLLLDKQKDEEDGISVQFELSRVSLGLTDNGKEITSCACVHLAEREIIRREEELKGVRLSPVAEIFMRAFFAADSRFGFPVPFEAKLPHAVRSLVYWEDVKRMFGEMNPNDAIGAKTTEEAAEEEKNYRDRTRKRFEKARLECQRIGAIGIGLHAEQSVGWHTGKALRAFPATWAKKRDEEPSDPTLEIPL